MSKKKEESAGLKELKEKLLQEKVVVGIDRVMKELKKDCLNKIFLASNVRDDLRKDLIHYAGLQGVTVEELELSNEELGILCKKNFFVAVVGTVE
ncbi:MAG: ribosomal L7Ae/L30e/S12e/Gadd45 family protein [Candidatus Woesearchaeota archaeon]